MVYDSSLDNQHSTSRKFAKKWFRPYVVKQVYDNTTYLLRELDGAELKIPIAGKKTKLFQRRGDDHLVEEMEDNSRSIGEDDEDDLNEEEEVEAE